MEPSELASFMAVGMAIPLQVSDNELVEVVLGRVGAVDQDPHSGNRYSVISNRFVKHLFNDGSKLFKTDM
jgi:hypothetical protein